jgi:hypothetical protein
MHPSDLIRLPKQLEADPRGQQIIQILTACTRLLWAGGALKIPDVPLTRRLTDALRNARNAGQIVRGLEGADNRLEKEQHGLTMADRKTGVQRGVRISRLLILSNDGSERFYRSVESLLRRSGPRVLAVRLDADAVHLGELLYGPDRIARLIMIEHKEHVAAVLLALIQE